MRFYAAVPIRSQTGVIGIYCVDDKNKRDGLDKKGRESLDGLASAIVQHLELLKDQYDLKRARGMAQGLGLFVEGKYGWGDHERTAPQPVRETTSQWSPPQDPHGNQTDSLSKTFNAHITPDLPIPTLPPAMAGAKARAAKRISSSASLGPRERKLSVDDTAFESITATGTVEQFSRASSTIRQAIGLDGVMFMDRGFSSGVVNSSNLYPRYLPLKRRHPRARKEDPHLARVVPNLHRASCLDIPLEIALINELKRR